ncbi:enoyl-CoA hydratase [Lysinibacillus yapensis]|uniref:Enoyl-CoA hydratase n=1 Tax=Ureibacillus yapensis TaxID=2304605 RepID=A0A396SHY0_9BACL|nr:enoyl-CoA hydratase [Lysinibacillus yapensis]RHW38325.1 enoyl-CoA hydratase [Lysinibacillus yapensis]
MELISYILNDGVAVVTIDNPPMNVLNNKVACELDAVFRELNTNSEVNVILLKGAGEKAFMAGADIKEFPNLISQTRDEIKEWNEKTNSTITYIANCSKPTIALLNGYTFGAGCELALACDIRIAEVRVLIALPEVKLGLFPGGGGTQRLPRLIGTGKAKELMFMGEPITADEAYRIGLVNQVASNGWGLEVALKMAQKIASYSIEALRRIKQSVNEGVDLSLEEGLELESNLFADIFATEDVKEGINAFIEKRKPVFINK